jgi:Zn-dependent protease
MFGAAMGFPSLVVRTATRRTHISARPMSLLNLRSLPSRFANLRCLSQLRGPNGNDDQQQKQIGEKDQSSSKVGMIGSAALAGSVLFGKAKYVIAALKITKLSSLASMLLSSAAYGYIFGWPFGIGMVGLIFVHECGHAIAMHHHKIPFTPMVFVPFMGASIGMTEHPANAEIEAQVALAGPILGSCAALSLGLAGNLTDSQLLLALADWGYMINLFNLLPSEYLIPSLPPSLLHPLLLVVGTLDGGRVLGAISPYFGLVGLGAGAGIIYSGMVSNPLFYLIMMGGTYHTVSQFAGWNESHLPPNYYNLDRMTQGKIFAAYLMLVAGLLFAMKQNNTKRKSPKQIQQETRGYEWSDADDQPDWVRGHSGVDQIEDWKRLYGISDGEEEEREWEERGRRF